MEVDLWKFSFQQTTESFSEFSTYRRSSCKHLCCIQRSIEPTAPNLQKGVHMCSTSPPPLCRIKRDYVISKSSETRFHSPHPRPTKKLFKWKFDATYDAAMNIHKVSTFDPPCRPSPEKVKPPGRSEIFICRATSGRETGASLYCRLSRLN